MESLLQPLGAARRTIEKRVDDLSNLYSVEVDDVELGFRRTRQCDLTEGAGRFAALIGRFEQSMDLKDRLGQNWAQNKKSAHVHSMVHEHAFGRPRVDKSRKGS